MRPELLINTRALRMHARRLRTVSTALALVAGLTIAAVSSAAASGTPPPQKAGGHAVLQVTGNPASSGAPATAGAPAPPQLPQNTTVTLPTGDQVRLDAASGLQQATPVPAGSVNGTPSAPATFVRFARDGDQYVVPDAAVPYLGSTLDPRLFDVSYLARAHLGTTGSPRIPVRITYTSAGQAAAVPGVQVTRRSGATAAATITTAQAARLGQLLASQWRAARAHHSGTPAGRLPGIKAITLAPPAGAPPLPASPAHAPAPTATGVPFYTLTLNATDLNGNPGTFGGLVQNLGSIALSQQFGFPVWASGASGSQSLSVPKGTYSLEFSVLTPDPSGTGFDSALVVKPQVTVDSNTTVSLDARTAVPYTASLSTPVTATVRSDTLGVVRSTPGGSENTTGNNQVLPYEFGLYSVSYPGPGFPGDSDRLLAAPTTPVTDGSFLFDAQTALSNSADRTVQGPGPTYVFDFPHQGTIPSSLTYTVPAAGLTTVHSDLYQEAGCPDLFVSTDLYLALGNGQWTSIQGDEIPAPQLNPAAPGQRTDYWYSSDPQLDLWQLQLVQENNGNNQSCFLGERSFGPLQPIAPGEQLSEVWNKAPAVPTPTAPTYEFANYYGGTYSADPRQTVCTACRQGNIGTVNILPFGDSDPGHYSDTPGEPGSIDFYRNGILAIDDNFQKPDAGTYPFGMELPLLPQAATYQLDSTENEPWSYASSAASVETDWTFHSGPADPAASLPATETCAPDATRSCSFLPLLFLRYDLPLNFSNQATAGTPEPVNFTVTGQQNAPAPAGVSATVSASFDGGQTWTIPQATTSLGGGQFTTTISQPALAGTNGFVSLRVTATDGSGDSVTQTITDAYGLTS
jgi:hypothetical protein